MASETGSRAPTGLQQKDDPKSPNKPKLIIPEGSAEHGKATLVLPTDDVESKQSPNSKKSSLILSDTSDSSISSGSELVSRTQDLQLNEIRSSLETSFDQEMKSSGVGSVKDSSVSKQSLDSKKSSLILSDTSDSSISSGSELVSRTQDLELGEIRSSLETFFDQEKKSSGVGSVKDCSVSKQSPNSKKSSLILSDTSDSSISSGSELASRTQDLELGEVRSSLETSFDQERNSSGLGSVRDSSVSKQSPNSKKSSLILSDTSDSSISPRSELASRTQDLELSEVRSSLEPSFDQENKSCGLGSVRDSSVSKQYPNSKKSSLILSDASGSSVSSGSELASRTQDLELIEDRSPLETSFDQENKSSGLGSVKDSSVSEKVSDGTNSLAKTSGSVTVSERAEFIESGKSSMCRGSTSSDVSDESTCSSFSSTINKPHKGNDIRWEAIQAVRSRDGALGLSHFRLLKRLGCGDIGSVYLAELNGTKCYFAMKVMDKASLASRKKLVRAQTEREILQSLDHPFLPTLYNHFETDKFTCLVMEFCPGGDLHTLRQRQQGKYFSEQAAKFYVAEVLLSLEYLHMLGIVYRDLKPENVLVRDDGHIMLSDFDLSLRCAVSPTLVKTSSLGSDPPNKNSAYCAQPACIQPACIQPSCVVPTMCFSPRLFSRKSKDRKPKNEIGNQVSPLPELIAEPTSARSMSFVGTHEYLAPEIIKGEGHGSPVDWWTFGIFLYELLFAKTPFKGSGNRATLFNVVGQPLRFPESPVVSFSARDLIRGLLVKEPQNRLGYKRGATEIKQHPFFEGVNWALIRCASPPDIPKPVDYEQIPLPPALRNDKTNTVVAVTDQKSDKKYLEFEFF